MRIEKTDKGFSFHDVSRLEMEFLLFSVRHSNCDLCKWEQRCRKGDRCLFDKSVVIPLEKAEVEYED